MFTLMEVQCPHCQAQGRVRFPLVGVIFIIIPCPECEGMFVVFLERVLALDTETMTGKDQEEKQAHLYDVIASFLEERIAVMVGAQTNSASEPSPEDNNPCPITDEEMLDLSDTLKLLDNAKFFRAIFGTPDQE